MRPRKEERGRLRKGAAGPVAGSPQKRLRGGGSESRWERQLQRATCYGKNQAAQG